MSEIWEEVRNEGRIEAGIENAKKMILSGKLSEEEIAQFSGLPIEKVRELAGKQTA